MALTQSQTVLWSSQSLAVGTPQTTAAFNVQYGAALTIRVTNGATGPTVAASVQIEVSEDGVLWTDYGGAWQSNAGNAVVSEWSPELPLGHKQARLVASGNTGQAVTLDAIVNLTSAV